MPPDTIPPTVPPVTPPAADPVPEAKPANPKLLSTILGLVKPEEKVVTPAPEPEQKPEPTPTPAPAPEPEKKKVVVRTPKPAMTAEDVQEAIKKGIEAAKPALTPAPVPEDKPVALVIPDDLTPEEREDVELAQYAESKDPTRKGLAERIIKFYAEQKKFLQERIDEEGDEYDPAADPKYKKFLQQNDPKFTASDRKKFDRERIIDDARKSATEQARKEIEPELKKAQSRLVEIEERPRIKARMMTYADEVAADMPADMHKFFTENGRDLDKTREAFPIEYPIVEQVMVGVSSLAEEFLEIRSGLKPFDPANGRHQFIDDFVSARADHFKKNGGASLVRDGKQFVPPREWRAGMEKTHWTFENEDVLTMLKLQASREAKSKIQAKHAEIAKHVEATKKRTSLPDGNTPPVDEPSPSSATPPMPGVSKAPPAPSSFKPSSILGFGTKS